MSEAVHRPARPAPSKEQNAARTAATGFDIRPGLQPGCGRAAACTVSPVSDAGKTAEDPSAPHSDAASSASGNRTCTMKSTSTSWAREKLVDNTA
ncbi:unnamed protein product [Phytophthora lilii]|uniref:Unnamed protein product n=1 Tax=Phytophthora lilii TaxID=2077276 RepID=A0A9W7D9H0_9STRA|nr:unnamed protein product [Phytophthora lilii]